MLVVWPEFEQTTLRIYRQAVCKGLYMYRLYCYVDQACYAAEEMGHAYKPGTQSLLSHNNPKLQVAMLCVIYNSGHSDKNHVTIALQCIRIVPSVGCIIVAQY